MTTTEQFQILIVDDSEFSRVNISKMLEATNYNIAGEVGSAKEAIEVLKETKVHIAIVDIVMPDVSGIELAQYITDHFKDIQIIMVSSLAGENIIIDTISAGASDFLQKPFKKEDLLSAIEKTINQIDEIA